MKYFVTNLNKHKHGIRAGISFIDTGIQRALHRKKAKKQRRINSKGKYLNHHHHHHFHHYLHHHKENTAVNKK